ncbi:MAG: GNAT family N-acetyltransferase [Clostridia bacterium]|nr:GNAT family N-acetyltransferase [Clostridia bacterium]
MKRIEIKQFSYESPYYAYELELRNKVLRKPLGLYLYDEDLGQDRDDVHIGAFDEKTLVGCTLLSRLDDKTLKMRQVAVDDKYQGNGIGTAMINFCERYAKKNGYLEITMHARKAAVPFYTKFGYKIMGDEFTEVTIPHFKMIKIIGKNNTGE